MMLRRVALFVRYGIILVREIWLSAISVTKLVFGPVENLRSGFLALPMDARSDLEITSLANSITLTPGTITVHVEPAKHTLVIHAIDIGHDPDAVRQSIKTVLERNILRWTRPGKEKP